jgi:branched-chain amino acid transport system substrate-binding protein
VATDTVLAGAPLSLSGRFAVQGDQARRGLSLWAEHANERGGLAVWPGEPRLPVSLRVYDDGSTIAGATAATERLIVQDGVGLLFGPYGSVLTLAAAEVAARHGRVLWNHGGSSDALEQRGHRHVVTLLSPASRYFRPVLEMALQHAAKVARPLRSVALLHGARGTFPQAVIGGARAHAATLGLVVVLDEPYPEETPPPGPLPIAMERGSRLASCRRLASPSHGGGDLSDLVARLASLRPDLVLGVGTTEADLAFAAELRRKRVEPFLTALVAASIERFREALGEHADGLCGPSQWEPTLRGRPDLGPTSAQFSAAFRARFGAEPDYPAAQAYAAGLIAAHCAEAAGSLENDALWQAAVRLDLTTFYGRFRLDPGTHQQVGHEMVVAQWQAGRKQVVWPAGLATAPLRAGSR